MRLNVDDTITPPGQAWIIRNSHPIFLGSVIAARCQPLYAFRLPRSEGTGSKWARPVATAKRIA